jgi:hypothetical protein
VSVVRAGIPPPPPAEPALGSLYAALAPSISTLNETRDEAVRRLGEELAQYEADLRQWLGAYESRRWPSYSTIKEKVAIRNTGERGAEGITLRITLPTGLAPMPPDRLEALEMKPPPEAPHYEERSLYGSRLDLPEIAPHFPDFSGPTSRARTTAAGPVYVTEQGHAIAEIRLDSLTHGVTELSSAALACMPRNPGTYELTWEAHVANLRRPAHGTIRITVDKMPSDGAPLQTVDDVLASDDVPVADH